MRATWMAMNTTEAGGTIGVDQPRLPPYPRGRGSACGKGYALPPGLSVVQQSGLANRH